MPSGVDGNTFIGGSSGNFRDFFFSMQINSPQPVALESPRVAEDMKTAQAAVLRRASQDAMQAQQAERHAVASHLGTNIDMKA